MVRISESLDQAKRRNTRLLAIAAVFVLALVVRLINIDWGLPYQSFRHSLYSFDEVSETLASLLIGNREYNIGIIRRQPFFYYVLFVYNALFFVLQRLAGLPVDWQTFSQPYGGDLTGVLVADRFLIAVLGALTVVLTYFIARRIFSGRVAIFSTVFILFSFGHILFSQESRLDSLMPFLTALTFLFILIIWDEPGGRLRPFVITGFLVAASAATKLTGFALLLPFLAITILNPRSGHVLPFRRPAFDRRYPYGFTVFLGTYFALAAPFIVFWRAFQGSSASIGQTVVGPAIHRFELASENVTGIGISTWRYSLPWHLSSSLPDMMGLSIYLLAIVGLVFILFRKEKRAHSLLLGATILAFVLPIGLLRRALWRDIVPVLPLLAICAGYGLSQIADLLMQAIRVQVEKCRLAIEIGLLLVVLILPIFRIIRHVMLLSQPDTREIAADWIESNIPTGTRLASTTYGPGILDERHVLKPAGVPPASDYNPRPVFEGRPRYELYPYDQPKDTLRPEDLAQYLRQTGASYLITSSGYYGRFYNDAVDANFPEHGRQGREFFDVIEANLDLVAQFSPLYWDRPGPVIKIYRVPESFGVWNDSPVEGVFEPYPDVEPPVSAIGYYFLPPY